MVKEDTGFESQFNSAVIKLARIHDLLKYSHQARVDDNHAKWLLCLDGVYAEVWAYLDEKKDSELLRDIEKSRSLSRKNLLEYLRIMPNANAQFEYARQQRQLAMEDLLDQYERLLIKAMKIKGMDLPEKEKFSWEDM